jgi:transketolase
MGIAEQNMISVASGLSKEGFFPIVYTIIPFLLMRPFEQIRVDIAMHKRKILLVGVGGGYSYDVLGPTHHALEDIALMKCLPGMKIYAPGSPDQITEIADEIFTNEGPAYLRLGKNGEKNLKKEGKFYQALGSYKDGSDNEIVVLSHGPISVEVEDAKDAIQLTFGFEVTHYSVTRLEPLSSELVEEIIDNAKIIFIFEESQKSGSLYTDIIDRFNDIKINSIDVYHRHPPTEFYTGVNSRNTILERLGLNSAGIYKFIEEKLRDKYEQ